MAEENINLINTYYLPKVEKDFIDNSNLIKTLNDNHIDSNEVLGIDKEVASGTYPIKEEDPKVQEANEKGFIEDLLEFGNTIAQSEIGKSVGSRFQEGFINIADFGTNIFNTFDKFFSLDPKYQRSEIFNNWSNNLENTKKILREQRKEAEGQMTDWVGMIVQDMPAYFAINKMLKKAKIKPKYRFPLAVGLSYAMSFDQTHDEDIFVNSEVVKEIKQILNVLPDTPENQLVDDLAQMGTMYLGTKIFQGIGPALKFIKRNVKPEAVSDVARLTAAGTVVAGSVAATQAKGDEIPPIPEPININEKPTIDVTGERQFKEMGVTS